MQTLVKTLPLRQLLLERAPTLGASFLIAELFYKSRGLRNRSMTPMFFVRAQQDRVFEEL